MGGWTVFRDTFRGALTGVRSITGAGAGPLTGAGAGSGAGSGFDVRMLEKDMTSADLLGTWLLSVEYQGVKMSEILPTLAGAPCDSL